MALATLSIDLVAQLASLQEGMDKAGRIAAKQADQIEARYARMTETARQFGAVIGGAISVAGLAAFFRTTVNGLDALNDLRDATGATIENISALEDVAARTGTSMDAVGSALMKFNKVLNESKDGNQTANIIKAIGLSAEDLKRLDPAEALRQVAVALDGYADSGDKARLIQALFGKSTKEVAAFLKDLAEQGQLNATVTTAQAQAAEDFNKQLSSMAKNAQDSARAMAGPLVQALNQLFDAISGKGLGGESAITSLLVVPLQTLTVLAANVAFVFKGIGNELGGIAAQAVAIGRLDFKGASFIRDGMIKDSEDARAELDRLEKRLMGIGRVVPQAGYEDPAIRRLMGGGKRAAPRVPDADPAKSAARAEKEQIDESTKALAAYVHQLDSELVKIEDLTTAQEALNKLRGFGAVGEVPQVREAVLGLAREIDLRKQGVEFAKAMTAEMQRQTQEQAGLDSALDAFAGRTAAALKQSQTSRLEARLQAGEIFSPEELERIVKGIGGVKDQLADLDDFTKQFASSVQGSLGETLRLSLTGDFDSIAKLWANMLLRMASDAVAADLTRYLFPGAKGGSGSGESSVGSLLGAIGSFFGGGRALGGGVKAGGLYDVNEGGRPELLTIGNRNMLLLGRQGGQVTPASRVGGEQVAAPQMVVNNNIQAGVTRGELMSAVQLGMQRAMQAMRAELQSKRVL